METKQFICIHGHFYQPPRENPWLEAIELQDSAYPYHDWNHRINAESYATNATARILNDQYQILKIINSYSKISFNFGPTLMVWLEKESPDVYESVLKADRESVETFSGHGNALAQPFNHMIMPLANTRDKYTQTYWGIRDFQHRFQRHPEGMWLPETAVDLETLEILAEQDIRFTILTPYQARSVRPLDSEDWTEVTDGRIDTTMVYRIDLPSGRNMSLFFYDAQLSHAVAFEGLIHNGEHLAHALLNRFSTQTESAQLIHIATDGETYGHHHPHADKSLAFALDYIETLSSAKLTNYGEFLETYPPTHEVEIIENTSWSCSHGIERWRSDCGCNSGGHHGWNQAWRTPLRSSLDWLRDRLSPVYEEKTRLLLKNPWNARNDYNNVILDRSENTVDRFLEEHASGPLTKQQITTVLKLLELQKNTMLMYTSCGWFFDDISGIESVQIIQYAGRAIQILKELTGTDLENEFLERLKEAKSNIREHRDGRTIYIKFVKPAMVDLKNVCAHYAMSSVFEEYEDQTTIYCYTAERMAYSINTMGRSRLLMGRARITSNITKESLPLCFSVLHLGKHTLTCGISEHLSDTLYNELKSTISDAFSKADFPEALRLMDKYFSGSIYSLQTIFRDEQRKILNYILQPALNEAETGYRQVYENNAPMMRFLKNLNIPMPKTLYTAAEIYLNAALRKTFDQDEIDQDHAKNLLEESRMIGLALDSPTLEYALRHSLERLADSFYERPGDVTLLEKLQTGVKLLNVLPFEVNLRHIQNRFNSILKIMYPDMNEKAHQENEAARSWVEQFLTTGRLLSFYLETPESQQ